MNTTIDLQRKTAIWCAILATILVLGSAAVAQAQTGTLPLGTRIIFDKVYASNPAQSQWAEGVITGYMPAQNYYNIRATTGVNYTIANDPRWIRAVTAPDSGSAPPQGTDIAPPANPAPQSVPQQPDPPASGDGMGARVMFDKVYASNPTQSQWVAGVIVGYLPAQNFYQIRGGDGITYTVPNDARWVYAAPTNPAPPALPTTPPAYDPPQPTAPIQQQPGGSGSYVVGTRIQFDRVEASLPTNGRWDSGVIIGRTPYNRYQIRGDNGIIYTIQDDPRWILPVGAPLPGPRHNYLDNPPPAAPPATPNNPPANAGTMPPDGIYNVTNLGALHSVGELEIRGASYRGLEVAGPFKPLRGTPAALDFSGGLAGLEDVRIMGAYYMGLSKIGQPVIKIRYVSASGFNEELEATKEH